MELPGRPDEITSDEITEQLGRRVATVSAIVSVVVGRLGGVLGSAMCFNVARGAASECLVRVGGDGVWTRVASGRVG